MKVVQDNPGIFRGAHPRSARDVRELRDTHGIKAIINLQSEFFEGHEIDEEQFWCAKAGVEFIQVPMGVILPPARQQIIEAVDLLAQHVRDGRPVYIHCHDGVDRTGCVLWAYDVWHAGISIEEGARQMIAEGFHLWRYWWWLPFVEASIEKKPVTVVI